MIVPEITKSYLEPGVVPVRDSCFERPFEKHYRQSTASHDEHLSFNMPDSRENFDHAPTTHDVPRDRLRLRVPFAGAEDRGPNIIVYMVDDLGWNHISAGQSTMGTHSDVYQTPNVEYLANHGLSFTHAYAQPNCAPTRAAMLSGQYPARVNNRCLCRRNI